MRCLLVALYDGIEDFERGDHMGGFDFTAQMRAKRASAGREAGSAAGRQDRGGCQNLELAEVAEHDLASILGPLRDTERVAERSADLGALQRAAASQIGASRATSNSTFAAAFSYTQPTWFVIWRRAPSCLRWHRVVDRPAAPSRRWRPRQARRGLPEDQAMSHRWPASPRKSCSRQSEAVLFSKVLSAPPMHPGAPLSSS